MGGSKYMSGRYNPYTNFRETYADIIRKSRGLPKTVKTTAFIESLISEAMQTSMSQSLEAGILIDEDDYVANHCRVYFPADSNLLHMLWKAKMDVTLSDIAEFPRAFTIAWPDDIEIEGQKLCGCLVWWGTAKERRELNTRFGNKYLNGNFLPWNPKTPLRDDQRILSISYHQTDPTMGGEIMAYRCVVPDEKLALCLKSPEEMKSAIGELGALMTLSLTDEERKQQFIMLKLALHLMVYATACPQAILPGWPDKYREHDVSKGWMKDFTPIRLASPIRHREGSSPETHWRNWHFRQYPIKKDGSRQKGLVFVTGCLVNADVDPQTVIEM